MAQTAFTPSPADQYPAPAFLDRKERIDLLQDRMEFHANCSSEFVKLLNAKRMQGPVNAEIRGILSDAINYHKAQHLRIYTDLQVLNSEHD